MNNTLDINRFGKILKHDGLNFFPNMILALAILWAIPIIIYLFTSLIPSDETSKVFDAFSRISTIDFIKKNRHNNSSGKTLQILQRLSSGYHLRHVAGINA